MNTENLKHFNSENASKNGKKGGVKSGESRRNKKTLRELLFDFLSDEATDDKSKKILQEFGKETGNRADAIVLSLIKSALNGDGKALRTILEICGELSQNKNLVLSGKDGKPFGEVKIYIPDNGRDKKE